MLNPAIDLYRKFNEIRKQGWIKTMSNDLQGVGYTFERLINKKVDNFFLPDFRGIEIKTFELYTRRVIHLFNATPDGDYLYPIERVLDKLGYPDTKEHKYKVCNIAALGNEFTYCGLYRKMILQIDYEKEKINFIAYRDGQNLDIGVSWSFELLKERLGLKLKNLAIVKAKSRIENGDKYFLYDRIDFYIMKDFKTFLSLIEDGTIKVTFKIGAYRSGKRSGQIHDHGTDFSIKYNDIEKLYEKIDITEYWRIQDPTDGNNQI